MIFRNVPNKPLSLNLGGELVSLSRPLVMGILNVTPDSFYAGSRTPAPEQIEARVHQIVDEGCLLYTSDAADE